MLKILTGLENHKTIPVRTVKSSDSIGIQYKGLLKSFIIPNANGDFVEMVCNSSGINQGQTFTHLENLLKRDSIKDSFVFGSPKELFKWLSE